MTSFSTLRNCLTILDQRERNRLLALALLAVAGACVEALGIGAVFPFISLLSSPELIDADARIKTVFEWSGAASPEQFVAGAALALLMLFVLKNLFLAAFYSFQARFIANLEARLASDLLVSYLEAPYVERLERNSSDRIRIITGEVSRVTAGFMMPAISLITEGLVVLGVVTLLLIVHPLTALLALLLIAAVGALLHTTFRRRLQKYRDLRVTTNTAMYRWVSEGLGSFKEAKVLGREGYFIDNFVTNSRRYAEATQAFTAMNLMPRLAVETAAVSLLLLAVVASIASGRQMQAMVPILTLFGLAAVRIMPSITRILSSLNNLKYYTPAVDIVAADLKLVASLSKRFPPNAIPVAASSGKALEKLELDSVFFTYPTSPTPNLGDINLHINHGEALAIVGKSGSGKTTLGDLLLGLLTPSSGTIEINGKPVASLSEEWQGISALVPQEFFLLDDTLRRNVAFGLNDEAIDDEKIWHALRLARLEDRVRDMPQLLDTPVGERGALLSGGERQRLSIARALYNDPEILVLDEATSALDPATEAEFIAILQSLGVPGDFHVKGPLVWRMPPARRPDCRSLSIAVFDVTPISPQTEKLHGIRYNYYRTSNALDFLRGILAAREQINKRLDVQLRIILKHKRAYHAIHDDRYKEQIDVWCNVNREMDLAPPDCNILSLIEDAKVVIVAPFSSPAYIAAHLGVPAVYYDPGSELLPTFEPHPLIYFASGPVELQDLLIKLVADGRQHTTHSADRAAT